MTSIEHKDRRALKLVAETLKTADRLAARGRTAFDDDEALRLAAEALISRLGEAAGRLSEEFRREHPDVPWRSVIGARNLVAHEYHRIDDDIVWRTLAEAMPDLAARLDEVLPPST